MLLSNIKWLTFFGTRCSYSDIHSSERSTPEILRRIGLASNIFGRLANIWKRTGLSLQTKIRLYLVWKQSGTWSTMWPICASLASCKYEFLLTRCIALNWTHHASWCSWHALLAAVLAVWMRCSGLYKHITTYKSDIHCSVILWLMMTACCTDICWDIYMFTNDVVLQARPWIHGSGIRVRR